MLRMAVYSFSIHKWNITVLLRSSVGPFFITWKNEKVIHIYFIASLVFFPPSVNLIVPKVKEFWKVPSYPLNIVIGKAEWHLID